MEYYGGIDELLKEMSVDYEAATERREEGGSTGSSDKRGERGEGSAVAPSASRQRWDYSPEYKVFVGGVSQDLTEADLADYFDGLVQIYCQVKNKNVYKISSVSYAQDRGFAFIQFNYPDVVDWILNKRYHTIKGKQVEVRRQGEKKSEDVLKYFLGGLDAKVKDEDISEYFQSLGVDVVMPKVIMLDKRSRCFGFVHFKCESDVDKVMAMGQHHIFGKQIDIKKAMPYQHAESSKTPAVAQSSRYHSASVSSLHSDGQRDSVGQRDKRDSSPYSSGSGSSTPLALNTENPSSQQISVHESAGARCDQTRLLVIGLPLGFDCSDLKYFFSKFGEVKSTYLVPEAQVSKRNVGIVSMANEDDSAALIEISPIAILHTLVEIVLFAPSGATTTEMPQEEIEMLLAKHKEPPEESLNSMFGMLFKSQRDCISLKRKVKELQKRLGKYEKKE